MSERKCPYGWLVEYVSLFKEQESPSMFHLWTGLSILAALIGRRCWLDRKLFLLYPNLFVCLVAKSAVFHKSAAINMGVRVVEKYNDTMFSFANRQVSTFSAKMSPQSLITAYVKSVKEHNSSEIYMVSSELSMFLDRYAIRHGMMGLLMELYDNPDTPRWGQITGVRGMEMVRKPCLNWIAGTTPSYIRNTIPSEASGEGLISRVVFVYQDVLNTKPIAHPSAPKDYDLKVANLIADCDSIRLLRGEFTLNQKAYSAYEEWYNANFCTAPPEFDDGYWARRRDLVLKIALLLSAQGSDSHTITEEHIRMSVEIVEENEKTLTLINEMVETNENGQIVKKVLSLIQSYGYDGVSYAELLKKCSRFLTNQNLKIILETLYESQSIAQLFDEEGERGTWYIDATLYLDLARMNRLGVKRNNKKVEVTREQKSFGEDTGDESLTHEPF